jgi:hypothetical protein
MTFDQIERLYWLRPFQPFEMLLADQRSVRVENLDFLSLSADHRSIIVYELPDHAEVIDPLLVVSLKFREPDLTADASVGDADG